MKRMFLLFCISAIVSFPAIRAEDKLAVKIELPAISEPFPEIDGSYYNGKISIDSYGITQESISNKCFSDSQVARDMHGLLFSGDAHHTLGEYSWIRIRNTGDEQITRMELIGSSSHNQNDALLLIDGSSILNPVYDADYDSFEFGALENCSFSALSGNNANCPTVYPVDLRMMWEWFMGLDGEIKTLRLRFSDGTDNFTSNLYERRPILQAIYIYMEDNGLGTTVKNVQEDMRLTFTKDEVSLSYPADIVLYDLTGKNIKQEFYSATLSLKDIPSGIYFLKATEKNGNILTKKIIH